MKTPEEIKKGLDDCLPRWNEKELTVRCDDCAYKGNGLWCRNMLFKDASTYIQQLEERNSKLEYTLLGVMHSVDKWLDVEPYDFDKDDGTVAATRASNAREVALKVIEKAQSDLAQAERERDALMEYAKGCCETCAFVGDCAKHDPDPTSPGAWWYDDCEEWQWRGPCPENTKEE